MALSHYLTLQARRRALLTGIIQILVPILMGTFVALLVLAFFLPLIHLIRLLSADAP